MFFFFSSRRRHTRCGRDWSSDVCSSDLGESLVNDATALVALQFAIAALMTGTFSPAYAAGRFVWVAAGGIGIGLLVGTMMRWVQSHLDNPPIQITFSLLTPFIA